MIYVLDTCALIAWFENEDGRDAVRDVFRDPDGIHLMHALNICELYYDYYRRDGRIAAETALRHIRQMNVRPYRSMDKPMIREAGETKALFRQISLADCFVVATARRARGLVLTADRREFEPVADAHYCRVRFIR